jgi:hypothetical protein
MRRKTNKFLEFVIETNVDMSKYVLIVIFFTKKVKKSEALNYFGGNKAEAETFEDVFLAPNHPILKHITKI